MNLWLHWQTSVWFLNEDKKKLLTTKPIHQQEITTPRGVSVAVVHRSRCHKWLGCILSGNNKGSHRLDLEYHLQAASRAFFANRHILCNNAVSVRKRFHFFHKIVTPLACFAAGHKKKYKTDLVTMDVHFRRLLRFAAGPPSQTNWLNPWHTWLKWSGSKICSGGWRFDVVAGICARTLLVYLTLDGYHEYWFGDRRILENVERHSGCGTPPHGLGDWKTAAMNTQRWYEYTSNFCSFIFENWGGQC